MSCERWQHRVDPLTRRCSECGMTAKEIMARQGIGLHATTATYTCQPLRDYDFFQPKIMNYDHVSWPCAYCGTRNNDCPTCPCCGAPKGS